MEWILTSWNKLEVLFFAITAAATLFHAMNTLNRLIRGKKPFVFRLSWKRGEGFTIEISSPKNQENEPAKPKPAAANPRPKRKRPRGPAR